MSTKNILLAIALVLIAGSIWYLQSGKVRPGGGEKGEVLTETPATESSTSTMAKIDTKPDATSPFSSVAQNDTATRKAQKAKKYTSAREIVPGGGFINTEPFKLKDFIGKKVILLDFWTYSCINCQRTTPYLNAWYEKYKDQGLVIVGVHTPEFDFEKVYENVANAVKEEGIKYPVVQDNDYATWQTYENRFWPRKYLIDIDGYIIYDHIGEGAYDETERLIQTALKEREQVLGIDANISTGVSSPADVTTVDKGKVRSKEVYFGADRNESLGNGVKDTTGLQQLSLPANLKPDILYLEGTWDFTGEYAKNTGSQGKIVFNYGAKNVYFVGNADTPVDITIMIDGKVSRHQTIKENKLYTLVEGTDYGEHTLEILINTPGLIAYTFTFG
ncbi:MAG: redoxin family protein [Patescibacteria group bacterium]